MADQKIVTETALSAFASDVKGELINKIGYDELPTISDNEPYNFRPSANGKGIGDRETDKIIGGSVAFNQVVNKDEFVSKTTTDYTFTPNDDGSISVVIINTLASATTVYLTENTGSSYFKVPYGHKYAMIDANNIPSGVTYRNGVDGIRININTVKSQSRSDGSILLGLSLPSGLVAQTFKISPMIIDLTAIFGSTIADYIYNLEQANTGAGVAYFRKLFPKPYYAYNAGELMSVKTSAHRMVGFNAWDEEWVLGGLNVDTGATTAITDRIRSKNFIPVLPNMTYCFSTVFPNNIFIQICMYDANKNYLGRSSGYVAKYKNETFITASDCYYILFGVENSYGTTYNNNICINISNSKNGTYEPYEVNEYALDSDLELRGILELDANNNLYYDGDEYTSDGNVKRKYGIVNLGTLDWLRVTDSTNPYFRVAVNDKKNDAQLLCGGGIFVTSNFNSLANFGNTAPDKSIASSTANTYIAIRYDAYTDKYTLKTALNGVYLVYELATPTTETADAYQNPQIVNDFGTEEYVDNRAVAIPVGHETEYVKNMDRLLLPATPSADGTYTLKCTVSGGTPTLSWVADT